MKVFWGCFALLCLGVQPGRAEVVPNAEACTAATARNERAVSVQQHVGGESGFAAFPIYDADGWPAVTYTGAYLRLPPPVQRFLSLHECGHLVLKTANEAAANCYALAKVNWSRGRVPDDRPEGVLGGDPPQVPASVREPRPHIVRHRPGAAGPLTGAGAGCSALWLSGPCPCP